MLQLHTKKSAEYVVKCTVPHHAKSRNESILAEECIRGHLGIETLACISHDALFWPKGEASFSSCKKMLQSLKCHYLTPTAFVCVHDVMMG